MSISAVVNNAVSGMQAQTQRVSATAANIANALTPGYNRLATDLTTLPSGSVRASVSPSTNATFADGSNVDLGTEMLDMIGAKIEFQANASAFEAGADMWDMLLSIKRD